MEETDAVLAFCTKFLIISAKIVNVLKVLQHGSAILYNIVSFNRCDLSCELSAKFGSHFPSI